MHLKKPAIIILTGVLFFALSIPTYASGKSIAMDGGGSLPNTILPAGENDPAVSGLRDEPGLVDDGRQLPTSDGKGSELDAPDYKNSIGEIQAYIHENIDVDIYSSLHIDRDKDGNEIVVLSFTQEIIGNQKDDILALADNPSLIVFRAVDFSEKELTLKQREIDESWDSLNREGIRVYHTGINVFINRVEIGVDPYNEKTKTKIYQAFGSEMIDVVQGYEVDLLGDIANETTMEASSGVEVADSPNLIQLIVLFFKSIINGILK